MPRTLRIEVESGVFSWLRERCGWSVDEVAKRLRTSPEIVAAIETGERNPTLRQLKELSKAYKVPLASFLLTEPIPEPPLPKDYRMLPDREDVFDKKTILAIRKARSLQEVGDELSNNIGYSTVPTVSKTDLGDDPEKLAERYRKDFRLTEKRQKKFKNSYEFFRHLRDKLEDMNILVFQLSMPVEDARGFALTDKFPNIIVINTKDSIEARLFSLMHEFGHVLLGKTAIDIPDVRISVRNDVEQWCNTFSSRFLLPKKFAEKIFDEYRENLTNTSTLNSLSSRYKVSKAMLLFNMYKMSFISKGEFEETLDRYKPSEEKERKRMGGIPQDRKCINEMGNKYVSIVANNYENNHITYSDALKHLSIKSKNFEKVLTKAGK